MRNDVRIGARAELLLSDHMGVNQVAFLAFNFSSAPLKEKVAVGRLHILNNYFTEQGSELAAKNCLLPDIPARRIYLLSELPDAGPLLEQGSTEIRDQWQLI